MTSACGVPSAGPLLCVARPEAAPPYAEECMRCEPDVRPKSEPAQVDSPEHDGTMTCPCVPCRTIVDLRVRRGVRNPSRLPTRKQAA